MVKKLFLTFLLLSVVGCSFSKKSSEEKAKEAAEAKSRASVDQVLKDKRYSLRAKIENAIFNKDKQLFTSLMANVTSKELNQMKDGKSLAEFALDTKDLFFVEGLFKTGMSPFIGADYFADGLVEYARARNFEEGRRYIIT